MRERLSPPSPDPKSPGPARPARAPRRRSWLARLVIGLVVLFAASWVAVLLLVNPARVADALMAALSRATGREVSYQGTARLSFGLSPRFSVDDVRFANPDGASRPAALRVARVEAELSLLSLLTGAPEAAALRLDQPDLLIERLADGSLNWQRAARARGPLVADRASRAASLGDDGPISLTLPVSVIEVTGGRLGWRLPGGGVAALDLSQLRIRADGRDSPIELSASGQFAGQDLQISGRFGALARLVNRPLRGVAGPWPVDITAQGKGLSFAVHGGIARPEQGRGIALRVTADAADASAWLALAGQALSGPEQGQGGVQGGATGAAGVGTALSGTLGSSLGSTLGAARSLRFDARINEDATGALKAEQLSLTAGAADLSGLVPGLALNALSITAPGPGQTAQANLDGSYHGDKLDLTITVQQPDVLSATQPLPASVSLAVAGGAIEAQGTIPPSANLGGMDIQLSARMPDLAPLGTLLGVNLPGLRDVIASAHLTDAGLKQTGTVLRDVSVQSSAGRLAGDITLSWSPRWRAEGKLEGSGLDLAAWWPPNQPPAATPAAPGAAPALVTPATPAVAAAPPPGPDQAAVAAAPARAIPDRPLPLASLAAFDLDLDLSAADARLGSAALRDLQAHIALEGGRLALNPLRAAIGEGAMIGAFSLDGAATPPQAALTLKAPSVPAEFLTQALGLGVLAQGPAQLDLHLTGSGGSTRLLAATLGGHIGLSMVDGQATAGGIDAVVGAAAGAASGLGAGAGAEGIAAGLGGGGSWLRCLAARMDFAAGIGTWRAAAMDHAKLRLSATGSADFGAETLDMALKPRLRLGPADIAAPLHLGGSFSAPALSLAPVDGSGRVGLTIGGASAADAAGQGSGCVAALAIARDGQAGPLPSDSAAALPAPGAAPPAAGGLPGAATGAAPGAVPPAPAPANKPIKKPVDLLRQLLGGGGGH